jgi:antitoxin PrlF
MALSRLSSKSQIVLPAAIRKSLKIKPGDELEITAENNAIIIRKATASATEALDACHSDIWRGYEEELDRARDQWN